MSDEPLETREQLLIAALYGELTEDQEVDFQRQLAEDADLRAEWDELTGTRSLLQEWAPEEDHAPNFVFLDEVEPPATGWWQRLTRGARRGMSAPAWGFAAATVALAILVVSGFRVDRVENGFAFRFGPAETVVQPVLQPGPGSSELLAGATPAQNMGLGPGATQALPVAGETVSRQEFDAFANGVRQLVDMRLGDYQKRQNGEVAFVLQNFYKEIRDRQMQDYFRLRGEIEGVELGISEQSQRRSLPDSLLDNHDALLGDPTGNATPPRDEDEQP